jgi:peptidoglycan/LPS O-acetylase OafA/YrhL
MRNEMIHRSGGFDALRLVAAAMVIFGHSYPLTGHVAPGIMANGVQTIGVKIFFVISGYLITRSWQSDPHLGRFWLKRALRIMPGLIAICLLTVLVAGPLLSQFPVFDYFRNRGTAFYFWNVALYPIYNLPGVFTDNIYPIAVNGSLWSLPIEVAMYCGVPLFVGHYRASARLLIPAATLGLLAASIYFVRLAPPTPPPVLWGSSLISALDVACYFYAGATMAVLRLDRFCNVFVALAMFCAANWLFTGAVSSEIALAVVLPYLSISIGKAKNDLLKRLDGHDYSYGLYLYGFPVQQTVVHFLGAQSALFNTAVSLPIVLIFAALSWRQIERRALMMKPVRAGKKRAPQPPATEAVGVN